MISVESRGNLVTIAGVAAGVGLVLAVCEERPDKCVRPQGLARIDEGLQQMSAGLGWISVPVAVEV